MIRAIFLGIFVFILAACVSNDGQQSANKPPLIEPLSDDVYVDLFAEEEEDEVDYEAYFFDSKGQRFLSKNSSYTKLDTSVQRLIEKTLTQAMDKVNQDFSELSIALEVQGGGHYRDEILTAAEAYIVSNPTLNLRAQEADVGQVLGKILKQELDPFYAASQLDYDSAKVSDLVVYILAKETANNIDIKISALSKVGQVLGVTKSTVALRQQYNQASRFAFVTVPFNKEAGGGAYGEKVGREFQLMSYPVSIFEMYGTGSKSIAVTNINLEQASNYCDQNELRLTSPYVFEFSRRNQQIMRPSGNVYEEIVAAVDYEDIDEPFYREEDRLELENDDMANTFITFNWNTEKYTIVSNSYSSRNMTFRCFKQ